VIYRTIRCVVDLLLRLVTRRTVAGRENLPAAPPYLLVTNHLSMLDSPLLLTVVPHTARGFVAAKYKRNPALFLLLRTMGTIFVRRGEVDRRALREALAVLERGEVLGLAPEGTRARDSHALQKGKPGAAYLVARANVPIVPVAITGTEQIVRNLRRLRRTDVRVVVGVPFRLPEEGRPRGEQLDAYTDLIMRRIAELLPEAYRGAYA
jgi:1-acyl-sn-glycerol-3-phosphate acyltransferase